jgi:hypothetical protein
MLERAQTDRLGMYISDLPRKRFWWELNPRGGRRVHLGTEMLCGQQAVWALGLNIIECFRVEYSLPHEAWCCLQFQKKKSRGKTTLKKSWCSEGSIKDLWQCILSAKNEKRHHLLARLTHLWSFMMVILLSVHLLIHSTFLNQTLLNSGATKISTASSSRTLTSRIWVIHNVLWHCPLCEGGLRRAATMQRMVRPITQNRRLGRGVKCQSTGGIWDQSVPRFCWDCWLGLIRTEIQYQLGYRHCH